MLFKRLKSQIGAACAAGTIAAAFLIPACVLAQDLLSLSRLAAGAEFQEEFSDTAKVRGSLLGGLSYVAPERPLNVDEVFVATKGAKGSGNVCVQIMTADGRYSATNLYDVTGPFEQAPALEFSTRYRSELERYDSSELLVLATQTDDCSRTADGEIVPAIVGEDAKDRALYVQLTVSRGSVEAWIELDGEVVMKPVPCTPPDGGAQAGVTHVCAFENVATLRPGRYDLVVEVRSLTGSKQAERYAVVLE